jgi:hypothetical protein
MTTTFEALGGRPHTVTTKLNKLAKTNKVTVHTSNFDDFGDLELLIEITSITKRAVKRPFNCAPDIEAMFANKDAHGVPQAGGK